MSKVNDFFKKIWNFLNSGNRRWVQEELEHDKLMSNLRERSEEERKKILKNHIAMVVARGGHLELQDDFQAVVAIGKKPNHILHLLLSIFTVGLWLIVWLFLTFTMGTTRYIFTVDERGVITRSRP